MTSAAVRGQASMARRVVLPKGAHALPGTLEGKDEADGSVIDVPAFATANSLPDVLEAFILQAQPESAGEFKLSAGPKGRIRFPLGSAQARTESGYGFGELRLPAKRPR